MSDRHGGGEAMLRQRAAPLPTVVLDIDTQVDLLTPGGKRPVANLEVADNIARLFRWARRYRLTVISSMDMHRTADPPRQDVPVHCLAGTPGITKLPSTLLPRRILIQTDDTIHLPPDVLLRNRQILFLKRGDDLTQNVKADRLLTEIPVSYFVLFGTGLEESIRLLALTLLSRRHDVWLVTDACGYWNAQAADLAVKQIEAKGAHLITTLQLLGTKPNTHPARKRFFLRPNVINGPTGAPSDVTQP